MNAKTVELYTDGSCLKNPSGPSGIGYIIRYMDSDGKVVQLERSQGYKSSTSNRMEVLAAITGITEIMSNIENGAFGDVDKIIVFSDSKYVCDAITRRWIYMWKQNRWMTFSRTEVKNIDLWERIIEILDKLNNMAVDISINHIRGHTGNTYNTITDRLAKGAAMVADNQIIDVGYKPPR